MSAYEKNSIATLETRRLVLRPLRWEDAPRVQLLFSNPNVRRYMDGNIPHPYPDNGAEDFLKGRIAATLARVTFESRHSTNVLSDLWEKFAFMAAGASLTCLMRASVGDIVATPEGERVARQFVEECQVIARAAGYPVSEKGAGFAAHMLTNPKSPFKASMLRDIESGGRIEADHLVGDMLRRGRQLGQAVNLLAIAFAHLKAYEAASRG